MLEERSEAEILPDRLPPSLETVPERRHTGNRATFRRTLSRKL